MCTGNSLMDICAELSNRERVRYFPRQLMTVDDMKAEQDYFRQKLRRHNRYLHGWGVGCGCEVKASPDENHPWQVEVCPGYIITPQGDEIFIEKLMKFDLAGNGSQEEDPCAHPSPCSSPGIRLPTGEKITVYLAACYTECNTRPVRVHPVGCACDEATCEYSRIRDSFKLVRLLELPKSHSLAAEKDEKWYEIVKNWLEKSGETLAPLPMSSCPDCPDDSCVVLATIELPVAINTEISKNNIRYNDRRVLCSVQFIRPFMYYFNWLLSLLRKYIKKWS